MSVNSISYYENKMLNLQNNKKFYDSYFDGFKNFFIALDIVRDPTVEGKFLLGMVKIISHLTLIIPIIFSIGSAVSAMRINSLKIKLEKKSVNYQLVSNTLSIGNKVHNEDSLIRFLSYNILNNKDGGKPALEHYNAFNLLSQAQQVKFFDKMARKKLLDVAVRYIPEKCEKVTIKIGTSSRDVIYRAIENLSKHSKSLKNITFDFTDTTFKTPRVERELNLIADIFELNMSGGGKAQVNCYPPEKDRIILHGGLFYRINDIQPVDSVIQGMQKFFKELPKELQICFKTQVFESKTTDTCGVKITSDKVEYISC